MPTDQLQRREQIAGAGDEAKIELCHGVKYYPFACAELGSVGFNTGLLTLEENALLHCHSHTAGESLTVLQGEAEMVVGGREYRLRTLDALSIPPSVSHLLHNSKNSRLILHSASSGKELRHLWANGDESAESFAGEGGCAILRRYEQVDGYELSEETFFKDLFAGRFGVTGICGGHGRFAPGASLSCHTHRYDESITIVEGEATCWVQGRKYHLKHYETAVIPQGLPHRFVNDSNDTMAMLWVYAGDEPERTIVPDQLCVTSTDPLSKTNSSVEEPGRSDLDRKTKSEADLLRRGKT